MHCDGLNYGPEGWVPVRKDFARDWLCSSPCIEDRLLSGTTCTSARTTLPCPACSVCNRCRGNGRQKNPRRVCTSPKILLFQLQYHDILSQFTCRRYCTRSIQVIFGPCVRHPREYSCEGTPRYAMPCHAARGYGLPAVAGRRLKSRLDNHTARARHLASISVLRSLPFRVYDPV